MDKFQTSFPMMLHRTLDTIIPHYRQVFKQHGISEQQWRILRVLWETPKCTTAELATKTLLPNPSMVGIIDRMQSRDLLKRDRCNEDRRVVRVRLTNKGQSIRAELQPRVDEVYAHMISQCTEEQWQNMIETLQIIIDSNEPKQHSNAKI